MNDQQSLKRPIFIHGIEQRSGTNFLWQLLLLHKGCYPGSVGEDFILQNAHYLREFSKRIFDQWIPSWQERMGGTPDQILERLGDSLVSMIRQPYFHFDNVDQSQVQDYIKDKNIEGARLVSKTPSVINLDLFDKLFPKAQLIIIVRDGRSVVESGIKSFNWDFKKAAHRWNDAANKIVKLQQTHQSANKHFTIVKFEDLFLNQESEIKKILSFLNLDIDQYDFDAAKNLHIYGSSELKKDKDDKIHWRRVDKTKSFNPTVRWQDWDDKKHRQFNKISGQAMIKLGYELKTSQATMFSKFMGKRPASRS